MKNIIILENLRSCYNVWNIIRTADALWWDVILTWYTPSPLSQPKVKKTSLWSEESVELKEFFTTSAAVEYVKSKSYMVVAAEITDDAIPLNQFQQKKPLGVAVVLWNEVIWVEPDTLTMVDHVVYIPMKGMKESLNVGQTGAIFMWSIQ